MQPRDFDAGDGPLAPVDWSGLGAADDKPDKLNEDGQLDDPQDESLGGTQDNT